MKGKEFKVGFHRVQKDPPRPIAKSEGASSGRWIGDYWSLHRVLALDSGLNSVKKRYRRETRQEDERAQGAEPNGCRNQRV